MAVVTAIAVVAVVTVVDVVAVVAVVSVATVVDVVAVWAVVSVVAIVRSCNGCSSYSASSTVAVMAVVAVVAVVALVCLHNTSIRNQVHTHVYMYTGAHEQISICTHKYIHHFALPTHTYTRTQTYTADVQYHTKHTNTYACTIEWVQTNKDSHLHSHSQHTHWFTHNKGKRTLVDTHSYEE